MITLTPAYGRDYKSGKAAREDFLAGKDFMVASGMSSGIYCTAAELNQLGSKGRQAKLRYNKLRNVVIVDIPDRAAEVKPKVKKVNGRDFDSWLKEVDRIVTSKCGIGIYDMRDRNFREGFDDGMSPSEYVVDEYGSDAESILEEDCFG